MAPVVQWLASSADNMSVLGLNVHVLHVVASCSSFKDSEGVLRWKTQIYKNVVPLSFCELIVSGNIQLFNFFPC